jgi:hypothetical protein
MHLDRFKHHNKLQEKSTQYYYFSDFMKNIIDTDKEVSAYVQSFLKPDAEFSTQEITDLENFIMKKFNLTEADGEKEEPKDGKEDKPEKPKKTYPVVIGTLVKITNFGKDDEPKKQMWNNSRGEVLAKNSDGSFKIRITDVKEANVLFSKNWYDNEQGALKQKLNLRREEFKTLKELEDEEAAG